MNQFVYISSDEEDDKQVAHSVFSDEKPKNIVHRKSDPTAEDDDCVVLDCDPYKTTANESAIDNGDSDDVLVVGQKGEIACRDYPHSRHACAKYPFDSTSHQDYCEMCHCYVCDTPAPCAYWFMGYSYVDHCHANDKEPLWKNQRECIRTGKLLPIPVLKPASFIPKMQQVSRVQSIPLPQNSSSRPVLSPASSVPQMQQVPRPQYIPSPQNTSSPVTQFGSVWQTPNSSSPVTQLGIRPCSASITVATHPNTYITHGYGAEQPRAFPQNPGLQPRGGQLYQNHRGSGGFYNGNQSPQVVSSNPFTWASTPGGVSHNSTHNIAQGSSYTYYTSPAASQGNPHRIVPGYIPSVSESHSQVYPGHFGQNLYSGNVQTSATVPSQTPNPHVNQQQQHSGKVFSHIEDWLMEDNSTLTSPVCPMSGQVNTTIPPFDFEAFLE